VESERTHYAVSALRYQSDRCRLYKVRVHRVRAGSVDPPMEVLRSQIVNALAPGATLVLSGLLHNQEAMILSFYQGLRFLGRRREGPWSALVLEKPGR